MGAVALQQDRPLSAADVVVDWVEEKRSLADELEDWAPEEAAKIRKLVDELEERVSPLIPKWISITDVAAAKGVTVQTLRRRARELADGTPPLARKDDAGRWEIRRDAAIRMQVRHRQQPLPAAEVDELAETLGREG